MEVVSCDGYPCLSSALQLYMGHGGPVLVVHLCSGYCTTDAVTVESGTPLEFPAHEVRARFRQRPADCMLVWTRRVVNAMVVTVQFQPWMPLCSQNSMMLRCVPTQIQQVVLLLLGVAGSVLDTFLWPSVLPFYHQA